MPEPQVPAPRPNSKFWVAVMIAMFAAGVGIFFWIGPFHHASSAESGPPVGSTLTLETFVVNLNGGGARSYLRVGIALELSRPPSKEEMPVPLIRDTILSVLSTTRPEQLTQPDGKTQLKAAILQALKDRVPQLGVQDVYFTEFLVQM